MSKSNQLKDKKWFAIVLLVLLTACQPKTVSRESFTFNEAGNIEIEAHTHDSLYSFIFDTGSNGSKIANKKLKSNRHRIEAHYPALDTMFIESRIDGAKIKIDSMSFTCDLGVNHSGYTPSVMGNDIIQQAYWLFDTKEMMYTVSNMNIIEASLLKTFDFIKYNMVDGNMIYSGSSANFLIDTGMSHKYTDQNGIKGVGYLVAVTKKWWENHLNRIGLPQGYEGVTISDTMKISNITILKGAICKKYTIESYNSRENRQQTYDAVITVDALKYFRYIYIDPHKQRLYLKK